MRLTDTTIKHVRPGDKPIMLTDGGGLCLLIQTNGTRLWRLRYRIAGERKKLSLGMYPTVSLKAAREAAEDARRLISRGIDPGEQRKTARQAALAAKTTFGTLADEWLETKIIKQGMAERTIERERWLIRELKQAVVDSRRLGGRPVTEVETPDLLKAITKIAAAAGHHETASRLRSTASRIFAFGVGGGACGSNPAASLGGALTAPKTKSRPGLTDPAEVGELLRRIDAYKGVQVRRALTLLALTFVRPGELRLAEWSEFDLAQGAVWRIPKEKMKMREDAHDVPLSRQALAVLAELHQATGNGCYLFPREGRGKHDTMSENTLNEALRTMGYCTKTQHCAHGFRTTASTLLNKERDREQRRMWDRDAIEFQLAHIDGSVRAIYNRDPLWNERVPMMQHWADKLDTLRKGAEVVQLTPRSREA